MRVWPRNAGLAVWVIATTAELASGQSKVSMRPIQLRTSVTVAGDVLALADLLPPTAPAALRARSASLVLGKIPLPGNTRVMARPALEQALSSAPDVLDTLVMPEEITVRRACRRLSTREIIPALRAALGERQIGWGDFLTPSNVDLEVPVWVTRDDPGLQVLRLEFDPVVRKTRVQIRATKERSVMPFFVTIAGQQGTPDCSTRPQGRPRPTAPRGRGSLPALIDAGTPAWLVAGGSNIRIATRVVALQPGVRGQRIRVRSLDARRILAAEVLDRGLLRLTP